MYEMYMHFTYAYMHMTNFHMKFAREKFER